MGLRSGARRNGRFTAVYCLDIGQVALGSSGNILEGKKTTFAWARFDGKKVRSSRDPRQLIVALNADLDSPGNVEVAIGIEAPMWFPLPSVPQDEAGRPWTAFQARFQAEAGRQWYLQSGAQAAIRALSTLFMAVKPAIDDRDVVMVTRLQDWRHIVTPNPILVWEAFVVQEFKPQYGNLPVDEWNEAHAKAAAKLFFDVLRNGLPQANAALGPVLAQPLGHQAEPDEDRVVSQWSEFARLCGRPAERCEGQCYVIGHRHCRIQID